MPTQKEGLYPHKVWRERLRAEICYFMPDFSIALELLLNAITAFGIPSASSGHVFQPLFQVMKAVVMVMYLNSP